ncbi:MAG TPA: IS4/IS5 family transposase [Desulfobacteraceae bacterium]|nr:IS4/IS5 family transposase [Desulfobacteraceae bacterium]
MNYSKFSNWILRQINTLKLQNPAITIYLIFLMASSRKHTLTAAARFSGSSKSRFHYLLKEHSETAVYALSELSKKQARQFSKINTGLSTGNLPWNIAISVDATIQKRSSLHTENSKRFNHGKGFVVGHQWTNIVLHINDKVIPLPPIHFYTRKYCKQNKIKYKTENTRVAEYLSRLSLEEYIGPYAPEKVVVLADSGYDDQKIQKAIAGKKWKFIIALKSTRGVKTEKIYHTTKKTEGWKSVTVTFKNNRKIGWQTIRAPKNGGKKKWMEFRTRQITGYLKNFGKAQLICSQFKTKSNKGRRKHLACNDLKATSRQIVIGYRLRWAIEIFHKEIKMFLGFEDVSAKHFRSVISHVHWVYCAYILMNSSPPGFPDGIKSMAEKQLMVNKIIEKKELSAVNQLLTQAKGPQRLKALIQKALNGGSTVGSSAICGFAGI